MKAQIVTTTPVGKGRPNYYNVLINNKAVCEIRFPSNNPYLISKTLQEVAKLQAERIIE